MLFGRKNKKNKESCPNCNSGLEEEFSFCPYCGLSLIDKEKELKEFGMLGKADFADKTSSNTFLAQSGFSDKVISSIFNSLMKNLDKQISKDMQKNFQNAEIKPIPNGFSIKIGPKQMNKEAKQERKESTARKGPSSEQIKRISSLPRVSAKSNVRRLGNKIVYELGMENVKSPDDIFVSKLENGYEIKAISDKHVYINTLPIELPIKTFKLEKDKITVEFKTDY